MATIKIVIAGPRRNKLMAEASDYVICFWDGKSRGTKSMIDFAKMHHRPLRIKRIYDSLSSDPPLKKEP